MTTPPSPEPPEGRVRRMLAFFVALTAVTVVVLVLVPRIWPTLQLFLIAGLLVVVLEPLIRWQVQRGIPRWAAALNILLLLMVAGGLVLLVLLPFLGEQAQAFAAGLPALWAQATARVNEWFFRFPLLREELDLVAIARAVLARSDPWLHAVQGVFTSTIGLVTALLVLVVVVFYTLLDPYPLVLGVRGLFPRDWWPTLERIAAAVAARIQAWAVGVLVLGGIIGILDFLALSLINRLYGPDLPFIALFAILAAMLEVLPVIGPILATVLPTLVGVAIDPWLGLLVLGAFFLVQQLEGTILAPIVLRQAVRMHPVSLLFALVVFSSLLGPLGALLAVPMAATLKVLYDEWYYPWMHPGERTPPVVPPAPQAPQAPEEHGEHENETAHGNN
jgi:predicted PurR-regulated permease PerM